MHIPFKFKVIMVMGLALSMLCVSTADADTLLSFHLKLGPMANCGAGTLYDR